MAENAARDCAKWQGAKRISSKGSFQFVNINETVPFFMTPLPLRVL